MTTVELSRAFRAQRLYVGKCAGQVAPPAYSSPVWIGWRHDVSLTGLFTLLTADLVTPRRNFNICTALQFALGGPRSLVAGCRIVSDPRVWSYKKLAANGHATTPHHCAATLHGQTVHAPLYPHQSQISHAMHECTTVTPLAGWREGRPRPGRLRQLRTPAVASLHRRSSPPGDLDDGVAEDLASLLNLLAGHVA